MREETLYELETPYRQKFRIKGFRFGEGKRPAPWWLPCAATRCSRCMSAHCW